MMKPAYKFCLVTTVTLLCNSNLLASPISPEEALSLVVKSRNGQGAPIKTGEVKLVHTWLQQNTSLPTMYVFSNQTSESNNYMIVAADDAVDTPLLGYSHTNAFDLSNMPPAMEQWLENYSHQIASISSNTEASSLRLRTPSERSAIDPLLSTKWDQDSPYNDMCPKMKDGTPSVTGCVATALAQIMKYYNYPKQGEGSKSYTFKSSYDGKSYTASADFGNTTYDWDNMTNAYNGASSQESKDAVATLMYHCGVVAEMNYSPTASGSQGVTALQNAMTYFKYDKGARTYTRDYYADNEWSDIVYSELEANRPVLYIGATINKEGHAFVCDGYDGEDYFHINWGWGGMCDGYFLLSLLNPDDQGIGGASDEGAFKYSQEIYANFQPMTDNSVAAPVLYIGDAFGTEKNQYNASARITFNGGFFSYSLCRTTCEIGLKLVNAENEVKYQTLYTYDLEPYTGFTTLQLIGSKLPQGSWKIYPVFKNKEGEWEIMKQKAEYGPGYILADITSSKITFTQQSSLNVDVEGKITAITPKEATDHEMFFPGHTYNVEIDITPKTEGTGLFYAGVIAGEDIYAISEPQALHFQTETLQTNFELKLPADMPVGNYQMCLLSSAGTRYYAINEMVDILVEEDTRPVVFDINIDKLVPVVNSSDFDGKLLAGKVYEVTFSIVPSRDWSGSMTFVLADEDDNVWVTRSRSLNLSAYEAFTYKWSMRVPTDIPTGTYKIMAYNEDQESGQRFVHFEQEVEVLGTSGITQVTSESNDASYYNLQGLKVEEVKTPGVYIKVQNGKSSKVIVK